MQIVKLVLVSADSVHIGVKALAREEAIALECKALPLCKRLHNLRRCVRAQDIKCNRALVAVEVIVKAGISLDKQGCGNSIEVQQCAESVLKQAL